LAFADLSVRLNIRNLQSDFDQTEEDMKALQSVGQIIGEILKQLDDERCKLKCSLTLAKPGGRGL
jgi:26S proteasome regulatory subunit T4